MSSLENVSKEAIQCLVFADSYTRKFGRLESFNLYKPGVVFVGHRQTV